MKSDFNHDVLTFVALEQGKQEKRCYYAAAIYRFFGFKKHADFAHRTALLHSELRFIILLMRQKGYKIQGKIK